MFFEQLKSYVIRGLALEDDNTSKIQARKTIVAKDKNKFDCMQVIYKALSSMVSPHGVPSMVKSLDAALLILRIARSADPTLASSPIVYDFFQMINEVAVNSVRISRQGFGDLKVLCVEGLSGSGKSTLVKGLLARAGAIVIESFDSSLLSQIRILFSKSPEPVTTALDYALNYCTAYRIVTAVHSSTSTSKQLIIVDEFYHSVCARTVCANVGSEVDLKCLPASAFEWPLDLPTPTLVMFLMADNKCRSARKSLPALNSSFCLQDTSISNVPFHLKSKECSSEDNIPKDDEEHALLNTRETTAYSLITGPPTIALDASLSVEEVLSAALEACEEFGLHTAPPMIIKKKINKRVSMGIYGDLPVF